MSVFKTFQARKSRHDELKERARILLEQARREATLKAAKEKESKNSTSGISQHVCIFNFF